MVERDECDGYGIKVGKKWEKNANELRKLKNYSNEIFLLVIWYKIELCNKGQWKYNHQI